MEPARIDVLKHALESDPNNAFVRYALALELARSANPEEAWPHFEDLLSRHPEYSAGYLQAGMYLAKAGRCSEAQRVFEKGIEVSGRQHDQHTQSELQAALNDLATDS